MRVSFDTVDHQIMWKLIGNKIHDKDFRVLIRRTMKAQVRDGHKLVANTIGMSQGSVLSPVLSNIYLHEFDCFVEQELRTCKARESVRVYKGIASTIYRREKDGGTIGYTRFADDWLLSWNGHKKDLYLIRDKCCTFLKQELKLELSLEKTLITDVDKGFTFVGFFFQRKRTNKSLKSNNSIVRNIISDIPHESMKKTRSNITNILRCATKSGWDLSYVFIKVNQQLYPFYSRYKSTAYSSQRFNELFSHAYEQFGYYLKRRNVKPRKFHRKIGNKQTYAHKKYVLAIPPDSSKKSYPFKGKLVGMLRKDNKTDETSYFMARERLGRVKRLFPVEPIVPLNDDWREIRRKILERDNYQCVLCGKTATEVDHIFTKEEAKCNKEILKKRNKEEYLRSLCAPCHRRRHGVKWSWSAIMEMIEKYTPKPGQKCGGI